MRKLISLILLILTALLLPACAETDPYKRLDPAPTPELNSGQAADAFNDRWPGRFKCVQTVTIDFRVQTMTLVGYLIVQDDSFRLQGMTEQGLKLFDIAHSGGETKTVFAADEFDDSIIENISRDIRRVFTKHVVGGDMFFNDGPHIRWDLKPRESELRAVYRRNGDEFPILLTGTPPLVDWYEHNRDDRNLYRVDHYEWREFGEQFLPSTVVLRERGVISDGPSYKLTIKINEFETRDTPWPEQVFDPPEEK